METSQGRSRRRDSYGFSEIDDDTGGHRYNPSPPSSSSTTIHWGPPPAPAAEGPSSPANSPAAVEKEHMFDKVVTPSDVGKLNRLVIPKQHAERYFPLDTATNEKGLLLCFEDRAGKPWRFRYSYWNSSQSYVMTKGWSRFVKEKRLDAGDTVSFGRAVEDKERLFIDWKRRPEMVLDHPRLPRIPMPMPPMVSFARSVGPGWAGRYVVPQAQNYLYNAGASGGGRQYVLFRSPVVPQLHAAEVQLGGGVGTAPMVLDSVPVVQSQTAAAAKRVRLFGVNLDFPDATDGESSVPSAAFSSSSSPSPSPKGKEKEGPSLDLGM